jgi:hypothetical protein
MRGSWEGDVVVAKTWVDVERDKEMVCDGEEVGLVDRIFVALG